MANITIVEANVAVVDAQATFIPVTYGEWRPGDQKVFVADISKAKAKLGWSPKYSVDAGVEQLFGWVKENTALFN